MANSLQAYTLGEFAGTGHSESLAAIRIYKNYSMKKVTILGIIISIIAGILLEYQFHIFQYLFKKEDKSEEISTVPKWEDEFKIVEIKSPLDKKLQPAYFYKSKSTKPKPLIVSLHSWSADYTQRDSINLLSLKKDYNYIHPNFRGGGIIQKMLVVVTW